MSFQAYYLQYGDLNNIICFSLEREREREKVRNCILFTDPYLTIKTHRLLRVLDATFLFRIVPSHDLS